MAAEAAGKLGGTEYRPREDTYSSESEAYIGSL